jgi:hypothetical protein
MSRITTKHLETIIGHINDALGVPQEPYQETRDARGGLIANAGTCYLAQAYGGSRIEQMCEGGGSRDLLSSGYATKREVYDQASAWLAGFSACERKGGAK